MQIETLPVDQLIPYARNSRTHNDVQIAQIASSIREFGFTNPVLIDDEGGIIAGHGRVMAARRLGLPAVPCIRLSHLTVAQKRAYVIADNRIALNAGWDEEMLRLELSDLDLEGFDLDLLGFDDDEINRLMREGDEEMRKLALGGESSDETGSGVAGLTMRIGKTTVPLTQDEHDGLLAMLKTYTAEFGLEYGFAAWLMEARNA